MAPLAKLPVFWALEGRRVIVVGGSDAAAWKAELLAACGAEVHIYAETLSETFEALISQPAEHLAARLIHHAQPWHSGIFAGAELAIADCDDDADAMAFANAAYAAGVPANVIDKPAFCRFQFGSIVNRSPVVVAISTDGAAPVLAQAIRRRIESLLPQSLKAWAEMAQSLRESINECLSPGPQRRAFWERFVDRAFGPSPDCRSIEAVLEDVATAATGQCRRSRMTLIGIHPDDPELLTLKAIRALQAADLILFDDRISAEVLDLARREAERRPVATSRDPKTDPSDIVDTTVTSLSAGKTIVRLTVDRSTIFRETGLLHARGISVDIIPGVTAADVPQPFSEARGRKFGKNRLRASMANAGNKEPALVSNG